MPTPERPVEERIREFEEMDFWRKAGFALGMYPDALREIASLRQQLAEARGALRGLVGILRDDFHTEAGDPVAEDVLAVCFDLEYVAAYQRAARTLASDTETLREE